MKIWKITRTTMNIERLFNMSKEEIFDEQGYIYPYILDAIENVLVKNPLENLSLAKKLFVFCLKLNKYNDCTYWDNVEIRGEKQKVWYYSTAGWSGNEELIYILERSLLWNTYWERMDKGGHYYFKIDEDLECLLDN